MKQYDRHENVCNTTQTNVHNGKWRYTKMYNTQHRQTYVMIVHYGKQRYPKMYDTQHRQMYTMNIHMANRGTQKHTQSEILFYYRMRCHNLIVYCIFSITFQYQSEVFHTTTNLATHMLTAKTGPHRTAKPNFRRQKLEKKSLAQEVRQKSDISEHRSKGWG